MMKQGNKQLVITREFWREPLGNAREGVEKGLADEAEDIAERHGFRIRKISDVSWKQMYGKWIARIQATWEKIK